MSDAIPTGSDGLPDIRAMGQVTNPGRHNIGMSAHAAADYLELKLQVLEFDPLWETSDSAFVEMLVFCATHGLKATQVLFSDWRPVTRDSRKASTLTDPNLSVGGPQQANQNTKRMMQRINDTIRKRKEKTSERLEFFRAYPDAARERKRALCGKQRRVRDLEKEG